MCGTHHDHSNNAGTEQHPVNLSDLYTRSEFDKGVNIYDNERSASVGSMLSRFTAHANRRNSEGRENGQPIYTHSEEVLVPGKGFESMKTSAFNGLTAAGFRGIEISRADTISPRVREYLKEEGYDEEFVNQLCVMRLQISW